MERITTVQNRDTVDTCLDQTVTSYIVLDKGSSSGSRQVGEHFQARIYNMYSFHTNSHKSSSYENKGLLQPNRSYTKLL